MRKLIFLLTALICLNASAKVLSQRVSISVRNAPLEKVLEEIRKQSGYSFFYDASYLKQAVPVTMHAKEVPVSEALEKAFAGQPFTWEIIERTIVIKPRPVAREAASASSLVQEVTGKVTNEEGQPLAGATIAVKGTEKVVLSDDNGLFRIASLEPTAVLVVSYTGYAAQEIAVAGRSQISITLKAEETIMNNVVVVGYGVQKRANLTGAVTTISEKDIKNRVASTAAVALQGADPSINLTLGTGVLDAGYKIDIRGAASVNGGSPLIMADGIEVSLSQINPNDIESITVLKDASAAAVYGAKASSGVILITTKKGKNMGGRSRITYNGRYGVSENTTSTDFIRTGYDHVTLANNFYEAYQGTKMALYSDDDLQMLLDRKHDRTEHPDRPWTVVKSDNKYYYYGNFDWYGYFFSRQRPQQEHNVSASGGNDNLNYYVSGRYWSQEGLFNVYNDNYHNYSFRAKIEARIKPWLKYMGNASYNTANYKYAGYSDEQQTIHALQSNIYASFVPRNPDGTIVQYTNQLNANSPIGAGHGGFLTADMARNARGNKYVVLSNQFDAELTRGLTLTGSYAYKMRNRLNTYRNMPFEYSRAVNSVQTFTSGTIYNMYAENHFDVNNHNLNIYGTYDKSWNKTHNFKAVLGGQYEDYRQVNLSVEKKDLLSNDLSSFSIANGEAIITQGIGAFRTMGYFSRLNYDYKGRYMLEVSGRYDGTSRFARHDRWGFFPAASAGWRMSEERFWEPFRSVVNNSKLRFSVGSLGNQQVDYYSYIDQISASNTMSYTFDGATNALYASVSNPISSSLTWETVTTYDLGLDLSFLRNKLNVIADYYVRNTTDMLTPSLTLPSVYGANTPTANAADLRTKGWELYVNWNNTARVSGKSLNYNIGATLGDYQTTITRYNNPDKLISDYYEGMTLGEIWGYRVEGLFATDADAAHYQSKVNDRAVNNRVYGSKKDSYLRAGDVQFLDLDGNGIINEGSGTVGDPGDKRIIGNSLPRYSYSLRLGANWSGMDVAVFFQGVGKQNWYPASLAYDFWGPYSFPSLSFIHQDFLTNTWSEENPGSYFPRPRGYSSYSAGALGVVNDRYLQDVSYLRLKNLTLGYTLPIGRKHIEKLRFYASGENLFYWSKLKQHSKVVDPELANSTSTYNSGSGVGYSFSKIYTAGIELTF